MLRVKTPTEEDWPQINWLASNEVQEADHSQHEAHWIRRRREFDGKKHETIVLRDDRVVGYCSLERDPSHDGFRAFVVLDWSAGDYEVQDAVINQLELLIRRSRSPRIWMRELEDDRTLISFMSQHGFQVVKCYELDGTRFINLVRYETES